MLLPLYLRREPTTDAVLRAHLLTWPASIPRPARYDVVAYRDPACTVPAARWNWFYSNRPTRAFKRVFFNCYRWRAVWLPPLLA